MAKCQSLGQFTLGVHMVGIYKITNRINGKIYIGQSRDIKTRWKSHQYIAFRSTGAGYNYPLYVDMRKYGLDAFDFEVLEECLIEDLNEKERYWIQYYDSFTRGYNQMEGGQYFPVAGKLSEQDVVEIRKLLAKSSFSQKEIGQKYGVSINTISAINLGKSQRIDGIDYPIRKDILNCPKKEQHCIICNRVIDKKATYCKSCYQKTLIMKIASNNKQVRPSREILKEKIRTMSFCSIGREYSVTDNAIRKWCDSYNLPRRKQDIMAYSDDEWAKL